MFINENRIDKNKAALFVLFLFYSICILYITVFSREPTYRRRVLTPLWEYRQLIYDDSCYWFQQITCNILMFVPFGAFLGYRFKRMTIIQAIVLGGAFSVFIEITQYLTLRGLLEFDDVFNNTFGAVFGFVFIKLILVYMEYKRTVNYY